jgi:hypothetical protein
MYLSPLVDVNEIDLTTTIPAVATSIGVIIVRDTWKGPELKVQLVNSIDELIDIFGQPEEAVDNEHGQSYEDLIAAAGFLQYGNNLYCTRVLSPSATFAGVYGTMDVLGASSSSSSSSTGCVQEWYSVIDADNWFIDYGTWNDSANKWIGEGAAPGYWVFRTIAPEELNLWEVFPPKIRFTINNIPSASTAAEITGILIKDLNGNVLASAGDAYDIGFGFSPITLSGGDGVSTTIKFTNLTSFYQPSGSTYYPIAEIFIFSSSDNKFEITGFDYYENCGSISSSSTSSTSVCPLTCSYESGCDTTWWSAPTGSYVSEITGYQSDVNGKVGLINDIGWASYTPSLFVFCLENNTANVDVFIQEVNFPGRTSMIFTDVSGGILDISNLSEELYTIQVKSVDGSEFNIKFALDPQPQQQT